MEITSLLQVKNGDIYAGTPHGLYSIDHDDHSCYYTDITCGVKSMLQTQKGDICVATTEGLFCSQDNGYSWHSYFSGFAATALLQVNDETIYMTGNWFARLGGHCELWYRYNLYYGRGSPAKWAGTVAVADSKKPTSLGQVRLGTASGSEKVVLVGFEDGLYGVIEGEEPLLPSWKRILDSNHVNFIHTLYASKKPRSTIIIGDEDAVAYSDFSKFGRLHREIFPSLRGCSVSSFLAKRKGKVLFFGVARGGDHKLAGVYRGQMQLLYPLFVIENFDYLDLWSYPVYRTFLQGSDGTLYVGGELGFYSFTINNRGHRVKFHLIHQCYVTCLAEDDDDQKSIYVGTDKGLYRWIKSSNLWRRIEYVDDAVTVLAKVRGEENGKGDFFLAGTRSKGFYQRHWESRSWPFPTWFAPDRFNINLLRYHVSVLSLVKYKNQYVVGTDHGVYRLDKVEYGHWELVLRSHGAIIHTLFKSAETLYAGTDVGLWSTKSGDLSGHWTREVLPGNQASVFTMLECTKHDQRYGFVLTGTGRGLFYRDPEDKTNKWQTASIFQRSTIYALFQSQNGDVCISVFDSRIWVSPVELPNKK